MMLMARRFSVLLLLAIATVVLAAQDQDPATLGPKVGAPLPEFSAVDQFGRTQTLSSLAGPQGLMLVFFRSADW
jgi:hypothetical protein